MGEPEKIIALSGPPAAQALALELVTKTDLMRLKVLARMHARGLPPDVGWSDLLQEAFARVLEGSRAVPAGVPMVAFLAQIMRSIKTDYWRRTRRDASSLSSQADETASQIIGGVPVDPQPSPERMLIAIEEVIAIEKLFVEDPSARQVITALYEGFTANEICQRFSLSKTEYESTRKRIRRLLIKEHLRLPQP